MHDGNSLIGSSVIFYFYSFFFFGLFRAAPVANGGSQARGPIRAVAAGLQHSHSNASSQVNDDSHFEGEKKHVS